MLKQFLKLFRSSDDLAGSVEHPHINSLQEQSERGLTYLEFILETVTPRVEERLKAQPQSDPILEVATSILLELFPEYWVEAAGPLSDDWSPKIQPPPPPGGAAAPPEAPEAAGEEEDSEAVEEVEEVAEESEEADVTDEGAESDDAEEVEVIEASEVVQELDEVGASEDAHVHSEAPAGFESALDDTAEFEPPPVVPGRDSGQLWPRSLDEPAVLHGARILLAVLLDNDRLPVGQQLSVAETLVAANLWVHLVAQDTDLNTRVQNLARLVEQKFSEGHFSQARILLQIFPANTETRINNDRQLYYEEMILRMGIRRRKPMMGGNAEEISSQLRHLELDDDQAIRDIFADLASTVQATMHVYTRDLNEVRRWREVMDHCELPNVESYFLSRIPPRRWRGIALEGQRPIRRILREHIVRPMVRDHVIGHLKTCYFVLRAVGDTGLEPYLDAFFNWSESTCGVQATRFMPEVYNRTLGTTELIDEVFRDIFERHYRGPMGEVLSELDDERLAEAFSTAMERIADSGLGELAPGHFNLGGFVLDACIGFEYPQPGFGFKLHRLT